MIVKTTLALSSALLLTLILAHVSGAGSPACTLDADNDGACDSQGADNCTAVANPGQRDDDEDGYGNICDWDTNQDCAIGAADISATYSRSLDAAPWTPKSSGAYDVDEDGIVGAPDVAAISANSHGNPGPTSRSCADCLATPTAGPGLGACP